MSWTRWLSALHWARHSSRPSRDSRDRTCGSCYSRTPGPADTRSDHHCPRHPRARHSHPRHSHRGPQGCSTAARYSYDQRISDLESFKNIVKLWLSSHALNIYSVVTIQTLLAKIHLPDSWFKRWTILILTPTLCRIKACSQFQLWAQHFEIS